MPRTSAAGLLLLATLASAAEISGKAPTSWSAPWTPT